MVSWVLLMQIVLSLYFLQILDFLVTDIFLQEGTMHFFSVNLSSGSHLVINLDLVKCITKININSYPNHNGEVVGGLSPESQSKEVPNLVFKIV